MIEQIVLGIVQGIVEWLPISSEGVLILVRTRFFGPQEIEELIKQALFLHLGTFLAALLYFRKDVWGLLRFLSRGKAGARHDNKNDKKLFNFLIIATLVSGVLGFALLKLFINLGDQLFLSSRVLTLIIGLLLLITAGLQFKASNKGKRGIGDLNSKDSWLLGIIQGLAVLPGLSRSGLTVSTLLLRKFNSRDALKLSFLMSLPIVLAGNIVLNLGVLRSNFSEIRSQLIGLIFSFIFGLLTINLLLKIAERINFGYFVLFFAILVIALTFV